MTDTFTRLFDVKKYGINWLAALAYLAWSVIDWLLWGVWGFVKVLIRYGQFHFPLDMAHVAYTVEFGVVGAVVVVGLAHALKKDVLLPILSGLAMMLWGIMGRSVGIVPGGPILAAGRLAMDFLWTSLPVAAVIIFHRRLSNRSLPFVLGFALGGLLAQLVAVVVFRLPWDVFLEGLVIAPLGGALTGLLFFAAIASHLGWKAAAPVLATGERPQRPTAVVLLGCFVSLFVPGLGHILLGYVREGLQILAGTAGAFALAFLAALVVPKQMAILPLFFVWLFAQRDLWGRRPGAGRE